MIFTDKRLKDQMVLSESKLAASQKALVEMVKAKHDQFDQMLQTLLQQQSDSSEEQETQAKATVVAGLPVSL